MVTILKTPSKHPSSAVLLDYAADTLDFAHRLVVETHVLHCQVCEETILFFKKIGGILSANVQAMEPPHDLLERCILSIGKTEAARSTNVMANFDIEAPCIVGDTVLPAPLEGLRPSRLRLLAPGIRHSTLWRDDRSTLHFIRVEAGVTLPAHSHRGLELTCVLSGAFQDGGGLYTVGDVAEEEDDNDECNPRREQDHLVKAEPQASCACIMATTGRLRFSGWMARLLQPVMPF